MTSFFALGKLKLGAKLASLALAGLGASTLIAASAGYGLHKVSASEVALAEDALPSQLLIGEINDAGDNLRIAQMQAALLTDAPHLARVEKDFDRLAGSVAARIKDYEGRLDSPQERSLHQAMAKALDAFLAGARQTNAELRSGDAARIERARLQIADAGAQAFDRVGESIDALVKFNDAAVATAHADAKAAAVFARNALITILVLAFAVLGGFAMLLTRHLLRQLGGEPETATQVARAVAQGDLTMAIGLRPGDQDSLIASLHRMQTNLTKTVAGVRANAEGVASASVQIAQGNLDLSGRTEEQASALEQTAASMEELSSTVRQNADNARQASVLAAGASDVARQGGRVVEEVVETMKGMNESSRRIADIIGVIDGIAFQTNILALNAAVEAARAGEQGRGFAVVAGEVRSLAQRSAEAAKEIKSLIGTSVARVEQGTALVDRAGATMGEIVGSIARVTDIVGEISTASNEQSAGVSQVGEAITSMDRGTQQNAALVEESAAAAESLKVQAQRLVDAVAVFRLSPSSAA